MRKIKIGNKVIGDRAYVIAEFGVNHNGSLERAKDAIVKAAEAGADAIKFQTYTADELVVKGTPKFWDAESKVDEGLNQYEAYKALEGFKDEWYPELVKTCKEHNIEFLSTPFSLEGATFLNNLGMNAFKIASSDLSYVQLLKHVARFGKPILLSTGAATMEEIFQAVTAIEEEGNRNIILLHCTLKYPTDIQDANLNLIETLQKEYPDYPVGLSDHTMGTLPPIIATVMGAKVIEKHYTVDKSLDKSADHWLSVDPPELKQMITGIHIAEILKGSRVKKVFDCEKETRTYDKRSVVSKVAIPKGTIITEEMLTCKRPGTGIPPKLMGVVIGARASQDIPEDTTIQYEYL